MQYNKNKVDGLFSHHYVRQSLLKVWQKYKRYLLEETPPWIIPSEVLMTIVTTKQEGWLTYGELLCKEEKEGIKLKKEEELPYSYNWLEYMQITDLYKKDKKETGLRIELSDLEIILLETEEKQIYKIYKKLLEWILADEYVKGYMTKWLWSINFNRAIDIDSWEFFLAHFK